MKLLNIGCGKNYHSDWINIDIKAHDTNVIEHNILQGLPFDSNSFDAVYSSHMLEHLNPFDAKNLLNEIYRVLKLNGIIRIVVPDLEEIARLYLEKLSLALKADESSFTDYEWMILELFDQMVRNTPGGEMLKFLIDPGIKNKDFVRSRIGSEAEQFWAVSKNTVSNVKKKLTIQNIKLKLTMYLIKVLLGSDALQAFREGLFRKSGEIHQWMYDRFSLERLLEQSNFSNIKIMPAEESSIYNFIDYALDVENGKKRKPDSLYMEGIKV